MSHLKWNAVVLITLACALIALLLCGLKYCCRDEDEDASLRHGVIVSPSPPSNHTENQHYCTSYSPYSQRRSRIGFRLDEPSISNPYIPLHPSDSVRIEAPYPTEATASYPLPHMRQPSNTSITHPVTPYPLSNPGAMPLPPLADEPPSYAEVMQNK